MSLIVKLAAAVALHLAFFASFPQTGPMGNWYLGVSLLLWAVFIVFINTGTKLLRLLSGAAGLIVNLAVFAAMALALAATMPQTDSTSVLEKLQAGRYPDRKTLNSGLKRFGINLDKQAAKAAAAAQEELGEVAKKVKGELK